MKFWVVFLVLAPACSAAIIRFLVPPLARLGRYSSGPERIVSRIATLTKLAIGIGTLATVGTWWRAGLVPVELDLGEIARAGGYGFRLVFFLDWASVVFLAVIAFISAVIIRYCRYYLHREEGYARFFMTIFLFISGMNLIVTAGTLDLLFAGWEIAGISSFLLIAFYRERTLPVRNAFRAYVVYRLCDIGLLLGIWAAGILFGPEPRLSVLASLSPTQALSAGYLPLLGLSLLLLLAASGKSAQFPFCYWLPRAMEGPTPSSAIFYGALSIHAGVFLLIRTFSLWHALIPARIAVGLVGALSALISTVCGRTQSNIKGQLAYASIGQVGLMLVELALGLKALALIHVAANAFLKCYQLLVSPSVVAQLLRRQGAASAGIKISDGSLERKLPARWRSSFYVFGLNEGYLEASLHSLSGLMLGRILPVLAILLIVPFAWPRFEAMAIGVVACLMCLSSLTAAREQESPVRVWNWGGISCFLCGLFPLFSPSPDPASLAFYFAGVLPGWALGRLCLFHLKRKAEGNFTMSRFGGRVATEPAASRWLFVSVLALAAFPITPTFLGEDILLEYCTGPFLWMAPVVAFTFVLNGLTLLRLYKRLCLGPDPEPEAALQKLAPAV